MRFTLEQLRALGRRPRVHPNGFIQLDIEPNVLRLNVWPAEPVPGHPGRVHPVHNHSFDLRSRVIYGELENRTFHFSPFEWYLVGDRRKNLTGDEVAIYEATRTGDGNDTVLVPAQRWLTQTEKIPSEGYLRMMSARSYKAGESYTLDRKILHDSIPHGLTATLMGLEKPGSFYKAEVAIPFGVEPQNGYRRDAFDEGPLWDAIAQVL